MMCVGGLESTAGENHLHGEGEGSILTKMEICMPPIWCCGVGVEAGPIVQGGVGVGLLEMQ